MKNSGFTLVELLAVIVVLSIIALIGFSSVGNIIDSSKTSVDKLTIKEYAKAVDQAVFLYEMNNSDKVINIDQEWITNNVKFEKSTVQCERIKYDKVTNLYGCKVNNGDNTYCYNDDVASECDKNKLYKIYGNSIQNGTPTLTNPIEVQSVGDKTNNLFDPTAWSTGITEKGITIQYLEDEDCFLLNGKAAETVRMAGVFYRDFSFGSADNYFASRSVLLAEGA